MIRTQSAKREGKDLHVFFLDLASAFHSVPHLLLKLEEPAEGGNDERTYHYQNNFSLLYL